MPCGSVRDLVADHIEHTDDDAGFFTSELVTLCRRCNSAKAAREEHGFGNE